MPELYHKAMFRKLFYRQQKRVRREINEYKQELLIRQGKNQFKKLIDMGLGLPIALR